MAAYTITTTVNGVSYTQTESSPFVNRSYMLDALSIHDATTTLQDQVYQEIDSNGCYSVYPLCTVSYILASSHTTPFVPKLSFAQTINASAGLDPGSNTYFSFRNSPDVATKFYGSISSLSINPSMGTVVQQLTALFNEVKGVTPEELADKVEHAQDHIQASCSELSEFVDYVQHAQKIDPQLAAKLIADAKAIEALTGCTLQALPN